MVEEMLSERGIVVSNETIRRWGRKFGPANAKLFRHHSNGAGTDFRREFVRHLACHRPYFSRVGVSGKPGAVQSVSSDRRILRTVLRDTCSSRTIFFTDQHCTWMARRTRAIVSTRFNSPSIRQQKTDGQTKQVGGKVGRRSPRLRGQYSTPKHSHRQAAFLLRREGRIDAGRRASVTQKAQQSRRKFTPSPAAARTAHDALQVGAAIPTFRLYTCPYRQSLPTSPQTSHRCRSTKASLLRHRNMAADHHVNQWVTSAAMPDARPVSG
ncbi:MAG: hypothetical protein RLZZ444_3909 [Pseudomonadota bacterium]